MRIYDNAMNKSVLDAGRGCIGDERVEKFYLKNTNEREYEFFEPDVYLSIELSLRRTLVPSGIH